VFLRYGADVLLLKGAPDKRIWANLFNGVGGHVETDEDTLSAARREVLEETGLEATDLSLKAVINVDAGNPDLGILIHAFTGHCDTRQTVASQEGELHWISVDSLNEYDLVEDLVWLLPRILTMGIDSKPLFLHYSYDDSDKLLIRSASQESIIQITDSRADS
jgi:8-oxo-dGTP diphosphatase